MFYSKIVLLILIFGLTLGEKILALHSLFAGSHVYAVRTILEELVTRGHQIRVVRWLESHNTPIINTRNYSETILSLNNSDGRLLFLTKEERARFKLPGKLMWNHGLNPIPLLTGGMRDVAASCDTLLQNKPLIRDLKEQNFSIAIVDTSCNECSLALAHHLNLPVVGYWAVSFVSGETQYTTAFIPPSAIPHWYLPFNSKMNFIQRVINVLYGISSHVVMQIYFSYTNYYIQKHLPDSPSSANLLSNVSGMLINGHPVFDYPKLLPPSFYQVGGLHIKSNRSLERNLLEFVESATDGVILFALGSSFNYESMPIKIFKSYLKVFAKLKQKVIVRSNIILQKIPPNVKMMPHVPQCDILAHPNTVLFITHCGMHGVMEAIHYGIKMVGIPLFFDQGNIAVRLKDKGIAVILDKQVGTEEILTAIQTVLNDPSYERNVKHLRNLYHDDLDDPLARSVWLIEHVIQYNGAEHLKMDTKDFNFLQYFCIDVAAFLILAIIFLFYLAIKTIGYCSDINITYKYKKL